MYLIVFLGLSHRSKGVLVGGFLGGSYCSPAKADMYSEKGRTGFVGIVLSLTGLRAETLPNLTLDRGVLEAMMLSACALRVISLTLRRHQRGDRREILLTRRGLRAIRSATTAGWPWIA